MKICAIDIKGNDAILVSVKGASQQEYSLIAIDVKKIKLTDALNQADLKDFTKEIHRFFDLNNFDRIAVRARAMKGKFAGGPNSFKIEALIQLSDTMVNVVHAATIKAAVKDLEIDTSTVNAYQVKALELAVCQLPKG